MAAASGTWAAAMRDLSAGSSSRASCNLTSMLSNASPDHRRADPGGRARETLLPRP
jgi:hypothetical protein